jgi:hypothetical protein
MLNDFFKARKFGDFLSNNSCVSKNAILYSSEADMNSGILLNLRFPEF